jgi:hypothetical protein
MAVPLCQFSSVITGFYNDLNTLLVNIQPCFVAFLRNKYACSKKFNVGVIYGTINVPSQATDTCLTATLLLLKVASIFFDNSVRTAQ